jgi:hypothetical protein
MESIATQLDQNPHAEKLTTRGQLAKRSNSSRELDNRDGAIITLIQMTARRRGLPLISVGEELDLELIVWRKALCDVPSEYLERAYDRAAEGWDWTSARHPFTPDAIFPAYRLLVAEDRARAEAERRNAARRSPETYACWHCCDLGYQPVFVRERDRWYQGVRPCCCEIAPPSQRHAEPLQEPEWIRNKLGQYVRRVDLEKHGAPNDTFKNLIKAKGVDNGSR